MKDKPGERSSDTGDATPQDAGNAHPSSLIPHLSSLILRPSSCLFLVIWLILLVGGRSNMLRDPGTLWHVAVGERMLASGQVIREDPFSFTRAGHPWVADQWLAECGMAIVHRLAGWDGLLLVTATLLAGVYAWIGARLLAAACTCCRPFCCWPWPCWQVRRSSTCDRWSRPSCSWA